MPDGGVLRVVVVRKGKVKPAEFRVREDENGLSLFRTSELIDSERIIAAVKAAGKQGELAVAEIPVRVIQELGLKLVPSPGGTSDPEVNALHIEARLSWRRHVTLWFCRVPVHQWFNETITPKLAESAKLIE